jgi:hypothetical protein
MLAIIFIFVKFWGRYHIWSQKKQTQKFRITDSKVLMCRAGRHSSKWHTTTLCDKWQQRWAQGLQTYIERWLTQTDGQRKGDLPKNNNSYHFMEHWLHPTPCVKCFICFGSLNPILVSPLLQVRMLSSQEITQAILWYTPYHIRDKKQGRSSRLSDLNALHALLMSHSASLSRLLWVSRILRTSNLGPNEEEGTKQRHSSEGSGR